MDNNSPSDQVVRWVGSGEIIHVNYHGHGLKQEIITIASHSLQREIIRSPLSATSYDTCAIHSVRESLLPGMWNVCNRYLWGKPFPTPSTRVHFGLLMAGYVRYFRASMHDRPDMELIIPVTAG